MNPAAPTLDINALGRRYPGEPALWGFVAIDVFLFSFLFLAALYSRSSGVSAADGHGSWQIYGLVNAIVLIVSSWLVATGVRLVRNGEAKYLFGTFGLAALCGCVFIGVKSYEYYQKIALGLGPNTSDPMMWYFTITGLHLFHLVSGTLLLTGVALFFRGRSPQSSGLVAIECIAVFWHVVDLLWIFILALFYLLP